MTRRLLTNPVLETLEAQIDEETKENDKDRISKKIKKELIEKGENEQKIEQKFQDNQIIDLEQELEDLLVLEAKTKATPLNSEIQSLGLPSLEEESLADTAISFKVLDIIPEDQVKGDILGKGNDLITYENARTRHDINTSNDTKTRHENTNLRHEQLKNETETQNRRNDETQKNLNRKIQKIQTQKHRRSKSIKKENLQKKESLSNTQNFNNDPKQENIKNKLKIVKNDLIDTIGQGIESDEGLHTREKKEKNIKNLEKSIKKSIKYETMGHRINKNKNTISNTKGTESITIQENLDNLMHIDQDKKLDMKKDYFINPDVKEKHISHDTPSNRSHKMIKNIQKYVFFKCHEF